MLRKSILPFLFLSTFLVCTSLQVVAQAIVKGQIFNRGIPRVLDVYVDTRYIDGHAPKYSTRIDETGSFYMEIPLKEPQLVTINYGRKSDIVFLEPNDTLRMDFLAEEFPDGLMFQGSAGINNICYKKYLKDFQIEMNKFKLLQFKHGNYWFQIDPVINDRMRNMGPSDFLPYLSDRKTSGTQFLDDFVKGYSDQVSPAFYRFLQAEVYYDWAYHLLLYGKVYRGRYDLDDTYFDVLSMVPIADQPIESFNYRRYIQHFILHQNERSNPNMNPYVGQFQVAAELLDYESKAFVQSELIRHGIRKKKFDEVSGIYEEFIKTNLQIDYDEKVINAYQNYSKQAAGTSAPNFNLKDINGVDLTKNQLEEKVIYLNFWASWCKPCLRKLKKLRTIQDDLAGMDVVFINVSFDQDLDAMIQVLNNMNLRGHQVWEGKGSQSQIAKLYEVQAIPKYFIIDKKGRFSAPPDIPDIIGVKEKLIELSRNVN